MRKSQNTETTLLWYDYETWGSSPARDRIAQFAAIRTDLALNPLAEPINLFCKPSIDTVIDPDAVAVTGLSPISVDNQGYREWEFAEQILTHMSLPGTCTVGYNSIRFDDECTRYLLYRNLRDPYGREWQHGNARWDILDVVRMTKALRPQGIQWPRHEDGSPSFKLEHLTAANGIGHTNAHDAVSDVKATIALAKLIKTHQPKLYDYAFKLRSKHEVRKHLDLTDHKAHLHFTGKVPAIEHCMGIEVPLMAHPDRPNEVIVLDIREDPSWLLEHSADDLKAWLYTRQDDLPAGARRPPLKTIHINRSPMIAPFSVLADQDAERLGVDRDAIERHTQWVNDHPDINKLALDVFTDTRDKDTIEDPEQALYTGFIGKHDRYILDQFLKGEFDKEVWLSEAANFHDDRLEPIIENLLARNFPEALTDSAFQRWKGRRREALGNPNIGQKLTISEAQAKLALLLEAEPENQALEDTQTYLNNMQSFWHEADSASAAKLSARQTADDCRGDNMKLDPKDQMDLF